MQAFLELMADQETRVLQDLVVLMDLQASLVLWGLLERLVVQVFRDSPDHLEVLDLWEVLVFRDLLEIVVLLGSLEIQASKVSLDLQALLAVLVFQDPLAQQDLKARQDSLASKEPLVSLVCFISFFSEMYLFFILKNVILYLSTSK